MQQLYQESLAVLRCYRRRRQSSLRRREAIRVTTQPWGIMHSKTLQPARTTLLLVSEPSMTIRWVYPTPPLVLLRSGTIAAAIETRLPAWGHCSIMSLETTTQLTGFALLCTLKPMPTQRSVLAPWRTTARAMTTLP